MKIARVVDPLFIQALNKVLTAPVPLKTAYKLRLIAKKIDEERENYDELRKKLLDKWGDKTEDGSLKIDEKKNVQFSNDNLENFVKELNELVNIEFNVDKVTIDDLGKIELSAQQLAVVEDIIALETAPPKPQ